jgi:hypothetical protein
MIDPALLAQQAVAALAPVLPLAASYAAGHVAIGFLRQPGAELYKWLAAKFKGSASAAVLDRAVAEPDDQDCLDALRLEIKQLAKKDAEFCEELAKRLQELGAAAGGLTATQTSIQTGDSNKSVQIGGSGNSVQIS